MSGFSNARLNARWKSGRVSYLTPSISSHRIAVHPL